jgi:hypothetical protein
MRVVLPTKGDVISIHREKAMIRDGHGIQKNILAPDPFNDLFSGYELPSAFH